VFCWSQAAIRTAVLRFGIQDKIRVGYIGLTCEAPIYAAYEKGFFKEEGLESELVKCNWATYKDARAW